MPMDTGSYFDAYWKQRFNPAAFKRRVRTLHKNYAQRLPAGQQARIVEVGPGFGEMLEYLSTRGYAECIALDNDAALIRALQARGAKGAVHVEDAIAWLSQHPAEFDCIVALHVLEHFEAAAGAQLLRAMFDALTPGGTVILEVPNMANFITAPYARWADYTHRQGFTHESLSAALRAAGFEIVECFGVTRAVGSLAELGAYTIQRLTEVIAWLLLKANYPQSRIIATPAIAIVGRRFASQVARA
ncbi:MAG TPA: class I SAM-dependent methyltransferase [Burkholderiaceae bacterium]|nr:class I SAM-dependent methyltransferase [Burkholderiaceae bacterium]